MDQGCSVDVRNQKEVWEIVERIGEIEKRMDMCVAARCSQVG